MMASQEKQETLLNANQADTSSKEVKKDTALDQNLNNPNNDDDDIDLSGVQIASNLLNQTLALDDPDFDDVPDDNSKDVKDDSSSDITDDSSNEAYKSIMSLCSSTTSNIKKSINDILSSREKTDDCKEDPVIELQDNLNKKMEAFKRVISGCLGEGDASDQASGSSIEKDAQGVVIEEVLEDLTQSDSTKSESSNKMQSTEASKNDKNLISKTEAIKTAKDQSQCNGSDTTVSNIASSKDEKNIKKNDKKFEKSPSPALPELQLSDQELLKSLIAQSEEKLAKKQKNGASKKKGEKTIDQILKSLGNGSAEEKLQLLCKKHAELQDEYRLFEPRLRQYERQIITQQREKESMQAELNRMILAKSRLEGLCREMQRQSKCVKEESLARIKEEEEKRKEIANKFQSTLNDIGSLMQENSKRNIQLREENAELATKLKGLVDNYEIWEQNMAKVVQQKELETQLAKAKHAKVNLVLKQETEKFLREKQSLLENLSELQKRCTVLTSNELQLRTELSDYTSKYEEFQSVLSNSSKVFSTFKSDMESTSKKIKKLEKETNVYKQKWESSNKALLDMISHKEKQDKDFSAAQQKIQLLEKLCRALQAERNELKQQIELKNQINAFTSASVPTTNPEVPSQPGAAEVV
ncbi:hypothetical protein JTE90_025480 [Oedothorax gibbosus]|uniref:Alpha-taxilin n=1 Tax=Oedothorax gibbosus TaxID=931172 RepID=A0AAV6UY24_9ARAC|nr:hypothetical protein JTE90_025480 [Oedothorax gibbosus]